MSFQVTTAFVNQYRANIELLLQQRGSKLRPFVREERQSAEFDFYDRIGATEAQENTTRHGDTPLISTPHDRRRIGLRDFDWADLIDKKDKIRLLTDPQSAYAQNAAFAFGRKIDRLIIEAAFGNAYAGKTGEIVVPFPAVQKIPVDYVETGSSAESGLTVAKLRKAREMFRAAEVQDDEHLTAAVTAKQITDLLKTTEVTNADYNAIKALVQGEVDSFMGFKFVSLELLQKDVNDDRRCLFWAKSGICLAIGEDTTTRIDERKDKRYSTQVYVSMSANASRMEEPKVIEVACAEA